MNLLYLTAVGAIDARFVECVHWCVASVRRFGKFDGDIVIVTDHAPEDFDDEIRGEARVVQVPAERLCDPHHGRSRHDQFLTARLHVPGIIDLTPYEHVMYVDADILAIREIAPLFDTQGVFRYGREFQPMTGVAYNACLTPAEMEEARWRRGINSGAFAAPADRLAGFLSAWKKQLDAVPHGASYDQPALNAIVLRNEIPAKPWPALSVGYPALAYFDQHFREQTMLLHYCGVRRKKFVRMKQHFDELMSGRPLTLHFPKPTPAPAVKPMRIAFDEDRGVESFALINSEWAKELGARGHDVVPLGSVADIVLFHNYTRDFTAPLPDVPGKYVAVRTSDFGPYPSAWVERINSSYDQLWVHTKWIEEQALASGIDPALIKLVPNGVDPCVFGPSGSKLPLPTTKRFKFLFVGGAVIRKGIDVLLKGYAQAFTRADDVCLVIKDHAGNSFYKEQAYRDEILRRASDPGGPEIVYLDDHLSTPDLAALFRGCDAAVFPFRAEGFNLPALEALACGTPTLIPNIGACVDFSDSTTSFLMPATRVRLPIKRRFHLKFGFSVNLESVDFCEIRPETLAATMRLAYEMMPGELAAMGHAGSERAHGRNTWRHSVDILEPLLAELADAASPRRYAAAKS